MDVPENLSLRWKKTITALVKGKGLAAQLQTGLQNPDADGGSSSLLAELAQEIRRSFTQAIFELTSGDGSAQIDQIPTGSACSGGLKLEDFGETSGKKKKKGRRWRYKKSKKSETWNNISETLEDGGAWRKYGQKNILHSEHPRCYFRCTHKKGQGCKATKQVQRTSDGLYQTTYFGYHTCKDSQRFPHQKTDHVCSSADAPNDDQQSMLEAAKQLSLQEGSTQDVDEDEDEDDGAIAAVKEDETAQSEISVSKSPDNKNDKCYGDDANLIWGDIIGDHDASFYACSSTSFNIDFDMEFSNSFPIDDELMRRYDHYGS